MSYFSEPDRVARYAEGPPRLVPGFHSLQRMASVLLAERLGDDAQVLVLGAGGGLELKALAEAHPRWTFLGVDPSAEMLKLARETVGAYGSRVAYHEGFIDSAPMRSFDGATCLLTLHFIPREERLRTLSELHQRLEPGAPLVVAHHSFPQSQESQALWLSRYAAFAIASGVTAEDARAAAAAISERLPVLAPTDDEALLQAAGFTDASMFYAGFTFRGWVAYRRA